MSEQPLLERVDLDDFSTEFKQIDGKSVNYYHWHQCLEFLYIESGVGIVVVDNQKFTARPGRLFVFPQGKIHKVLVDNTASNLYQRTVIHVDVAIISPYLRPFSQRFKLFEEIAAADARVSIYDLSESKAQVEAMLASYQQRYATTSGKSELMALLLLTLLSFLSAGIFVRAGNSGLLSSRIMHQIEEGYTGKLSLQEIAEHLGVSASYASRTFRKETGGTIQEYIMVRRIKHACDLLEHTEGAIAQIAAEAGFNHVSYFIRCFNETLGCSPLRYRNRCHNKQTQDH